MPLRCWVLIPAYSVFALAQTPGAQISGHVFRADTGEPLAKAIVSLYPRELNHGKERSVRSGADGAFTFTGLIAGAYAIFAERNGFVTQYAGNSDIATLSVGPGQELAHIDLRLIPAGVISGAVIDEDRDPIARLNVTALRVNYLAGGTRSWSFGAETTTDDQGNFRLSGLAPGSYFLRTGGLLRYSRESRPLKQSPERDVQYRETYYPDSALSEVGQPLRIEPGTQVANIRITLLTVATYTIDGKVEPAVNSAAKSTNIAFTRSTPFHETFGLRSEPIDPDGSFAISGLEPGEYVLTASRVQDGRDIQEGYARIQIVDANVQTTIPMGSGAEVRGKAIVEGAGPAMGYQLTLGARYSWNLYPSDVNADSGFAIKNLPPGQYLFGLSSSQGGAGSIYLKSVSCAGADYTERVVNLDVSSLIENCEVTLATDGGAVSGVVQDNDKPVAGVIAVLIPRGRDLRRIPRFTRTATSGADGAYRIQGVIPGDYYLLTSPRATDRPYFAIDYADLHRDIAHQVTVKAGETVSVNLPSPR